MEKIHDRNRFIPQWTSSARTWISWVRLPVTANHSISLREIPVSKTLWIQDSPPITFSFTHMAQVSIQVGRTNDDKLLKLLTSSIFSHKKKVQDPLNLYCNWGWWKRDSAPREHFVSFLLYGVSNGKEWRAHYWFPCRLSRKVQMRAGFSPLLFPLSPTLYQVLRKLCNLLILGSENTQQGVQKTEWLVSDRFPITVTEQPSQQTTGTTNA